MNPAAQPYPSCHVETKIQQIMNHNHFLGSTQEKHIRLQLIWNCCFTFIMLEPQAQFKIILISQHAEAKLNFSSELKITPLKKMLKFHFNRSHQMIVSVLLGIPKLSRKVRTRRVSIRISTHCPPCKEPGYWVLQNRYKLWEESGNLRNR